jgi:hypothetical protein
MSLNVAQYLAPLNSGQVLAGYTQGVKQGTGVSIATDGTISLNPAGAATLGFLTSSTAPAPIYNWSLTPGPGGSLLQNDGAGNVNWTNDYVVVYPQGGTAIQTGAAALPAGTTLDRPAGAQEGWIRYNTSNGNPEFFNGGSWIATTRPQGPLLSFVSGTTPTASNPGDLWFDTNTNQEKVWNGTAWVSTSAPPYIANLDDISGLFDGVTTGFPLTIASVAYAPTPTSNIMVFIGGIAQTPGATQAYTITGTNISFVSAPPTGASFYATTVRN